MTLVAGVDSSTQSCKVVIRDADTGVLVRSGSAPHPEGTAVDPNAWWDALLAAIDAAGGLDGVSALSVAGQQHGMVTLDRAGHVVREALLWNDTRSAQAAADLLAELGPEEIARRTGSLPVASFTATKVRWLRDAEPENAVRVAAVALPHDWLTWRLLGYGPDPRDSRGPDLDALVTDRSDASGTSYWTPSSGTYDLDLFRLAFGRTAREAGSGGRNNEVVLPRVLAPSESAGTTVALPGIPAGIVIGPGMGDNAGAGLGLDATVGDVVISIGTSGTAFAVTDRPTTDPSGTVAGFADATGAFLPLVATLNAARILTAIEAVLGVGHDEFARLALAASPGAGGVCLVPYFEGERTPNLPEATATLAGLTLASSTRENLARAAVEGLICSLADGMDAVRGLGVTASRVLIVGGAALNKAVQAVAAQVFEVPVSIPAPGEYVADGAARQAAWVLTGIRPTWPVSIETTLASDPHPEVRERYREAQTLGSVKRA